MKKVQFNKWYDISKLDELDMSGIHYCVCRVEYLKSSKKVRKGDWDLVTLLYDGLNRDKGATFYNIPKNTKVTHFLPIPNFSEIL